VPPELRRFLPLMLIAVFGVILLSSVFRHSSKSGLSNGDKATRTREATKLIESGEQSYQAAHGRFTQHLADLVGAKPRLALDLAAGLDVRLDVSTKGQTYIVQVTSDVLRLVRVHKGANVTARSCLVLKKSSGVNCP